MAVATHEQLLAKLGKGKSVPAIALIGEERYLREVCRQKLVEAYVPEGARQWGVSRFSLSDVKLERVLQEAETLPMLSSCQMVFVEDLEALEELGDEARDAAVKHLAEYLKRPAPFTVLVLEAEKLDQRTKLSKMLTEEALVVSMELVGAGDEDKRRAAAIEAAKPIAQEMARSAGVRLDEDAADELATQLNGELAWIRTEIEKLATYAGERRRITLADVDALVVSEQHYSVWQLADMLAARDRKSALVFLDRLMREGEDPVGLLGALAWMYRKLIEAQEAPAGINGWQAASRLRMRPEAAELALRTARRIPREQLLQGLDVLYEADSRLKSGVKDAEGRSVMEFLLTRLTA
jgi:DNA polymerase-3 subunit delta